MKVSSRFTLIALVVLMGGATLWPFNFGQVNNASLGKKGGLVLSSHSTAYTPLPPAKLARVDSFTLVLRLSAWPFQGRSCVMDYATDERHFNLRVEQMDDEIIFSATALGASPFVHLKLPHAFDNGDTITAVISSDGTVCSAWHSHGIFKKTDLTTGPHLRWDSAATITLGSFVSGRIPWRGVIHSLVFFERILSLDEVVDGTFGTAQAHPLLLYRFSADPAGMTADEGRNPPANLALPRYYLIPGREFLGSQLTSWRGRWQVSDILLNLAGFVPFGFFFARLLHGRVTGVPSRLLLAACAACLFSLSLETLQYFLPSRSSSIVDVGSNTLGGLAGAWIAVATRIDTILRKIRVRVPAAGNPEEHGRR